MAIIYDYLLMVKTEAIPNVEAVPDPALDSLRTLSRAKPAIQNTKIDRADVKLTMGKMPHVSDPDPSMTITIETYLKGSGTASVAPDFEPLLTACGMSKTLLSAPRGWSYAPTTTLGSTVTIHVMVDGLLWKFIGAIGDASLTANPGEMPKITFNMSAKYTAPVPAAIPSGISYDPSIPKVVSSTDIVTQNGVAIPVGSFGLNFGNVVDEHKLIGLHHWRLSDRAPTLTITKDSVSTATEWNDLLTSQSVGLQATFNSGGAGNTVSLVASNAVRDSVAMGERGDINTQDVVFSLYEPAGLSDNQFSISFE